MKVRMKMRTPLKLGVRRKTLPVWGMAMQDYGLGLRVGLKDLPTLRTRIHIKF